MRRSRAKPAGAPSFANSTRVRAKIGIERPHAKLAEPHEPGTPARIEMVGTAESFVGAFGAEDKAVAELLFRQTLNALHADGSKALDDATVDLGVALITEIGPRDAIEGMLAAQMVAVHVAAMETGRRALVSGQPVGLAQTYLGLAGKLMRTFGSQIEALNRHRGKGQQKVKVEHVHVYKGGQAIVGAVNQGQAAPLRAGAGGSAIGDGQPDALGAPLRSAHPEGLVLPVAGGKGSAALPHARRR